MHISIVGVRKIAMIRTYKNQKTVLNKRNSEAKGIIYRSPSCLWGIRWRMEKLKIVPMPMRLSADADPAVFSVCPEELQPEAMIVFAFFFVENFIPRIPPWHWNIYLHYTMNFNWLTFPLRFSPPPIARGQKTSELAFQVTSWRKNSWFGGFFASE